MSCIALLATRTDETILTSAVNMAEHARLLREAAMLGLAESPTINDGAVAESDTGT